MTPWLETSYGIPSQWLPAALLYEAAKEIAVGAAEGLGLSLINGALGRGAPAAAGSGGVFSLVFAGGVGLICQGDSSPQSHPLFRPQIKASGDGTAQTAPAVDALDPAKSPTPSTADADLLADHLWRILEALYLKRMKDQGEDIKIVGEGEDRRIEFRKPRNPRRIFVLERLLLRLANMLAKNPRFAKMAEHFEKNMFVIPPLRWWREVIRETFPNAAEIVYVQGDLPTERIHQLHKEDKGQIALPLLEEILLGDFGFLVEALEYALHEIYHYARFSQASPELRAFAVQFYEVVDRLAKVHGDSPFLKRMREVLADVDVLDLDTLILEMMNWGMYLGNKKASKKASYIVQKITDADRLGIRRLLGELHRIKWTGPHAAQLAKRVPEIQYYLHKILTGNPGRTFRRL